jgi:hypothetical protein
MALARFTQSTHDPNCSGCPCCNPHYAAMLDETPSDTAMRCASEAVTLRSASFRVSQPRIDRKTESAWREHFGRKLRGYGTVVLATPDSHARATSRTPTKTPCPFDTDGYDPKGQPPDPYANVKKERR